MTEEELRSLIVWLVEWDTLGQERAAALLLRILERIFLKEEKKSAKTGNAVYNQKREKQEPAGRGPMPSGQEEEQG